MYACSCLIVCVTLEDDGLSGSGFLNILFLGDFLVLGSCVCRYDGRVGNMVGTEPFFRKQPFCFSFAVKQSSVKWSLHNFLDAVGTQLSCLTARIHFSLSSLSHFGNLW